MKNTNLIGINGTYLRVWHWMFGMDLSGNEILVFAEIYNYTCYGRGLYKGAVGKMGEKLGICRKTAFNSVRRLMDKGFVRMEDEMWVAERKLQNGEIITQKNMFNDGESGGNSYTNGEKERDDGECITHKEKEEKRERESTCDDFDFERFVAWWNRECVNLPAIRDLTSRQKMMLRNLHKQRSVFETSAVFLKANRNLYLSGRAKGSYSPVGIDKLINEEFFRAVESGKYDSREENDVRGRRVYEEALAAEKADNERRDGLKREVYQEMLARGEGLDTDEQMAWWEAEVERRMRGC